MLVAAREGAAVDEHQHRPWRAAAGPGGEDVTLLLLARAVWQIPRGIDALVEILRRQGGVEARGLRDVDPGPDGVEPGGHVGGRLRLDLESVSDIAH